MRKRLLLLIVILCIPIITQAQKEDKTTSESIPDRDLEWSNSFFSPNIGIGIQDAFFIEAGISWFQEKESKSELLYNIQEFSINIEYAPSIDDEVNQVLAFKYKLR